MRRGLVSVILNAHNSTGVIERPICSVLAQTYENWELIVWDNASKDDLKSLIDGYADMRIRYFFDGVQSSLYRARTNAIACASGEFIAFLDHDDAWLSSKLELQVPLFEDPGTVLSCSDYWVCRPNNENRTRRTLSRTYEKDYVDLRAVLFEYRVGLPTVIARESALRAALPMRPPPYFIVEDMDIVCRTLRFGRMRTLHVPTAEYWIHESNLSRKQDLVLEELELWLDQWTHEFGSQEFGTGWITKKRNELDILRARILLASGRRLEGVRALPRTMPTFKRMKYVAAAASLSRRRLDRVFSRR